MSTAYERAQARERAEQQRQIEALTTMVQKFATAAEAKNKKSFDVQITSIATYCIDPDNSATRSVVMLESFLAKDAVLKALRGAKLEGGEQGWYTLTWE